jgi:hypothetical protein
MAQYNPEQPALTLAGSIQGNAVGKDKYGINDQTGLGPNGADKFISYDVIISSITTQTVGDSDVRDSLGLNVGGQYNGLDVKVGDWVSSADGARVYQITEISEKASSYISCSIEDTGMVIAKTRSDRVNSLSDGTGVVIFELSDNDQPVFAINTLNDFSNTTAVNAIQTYFNVYEPFERFTFYPDNTGSVDIGDLVTITGSVLGSPVSPYRLIPAEEDDTVIGVVSDIYGGNNINVRPYNKIITNFSSPELLTDGIIGSTWHSSGSDGAYVTSSEFGDAKFFQLSLPVGASITGSVDGPSLDETQYNLEINGVDVIPQDAGGSTLTLAQIVSEVNNSFSSTYVSASVNQQGGGFASATTLGAAGSGGAAGTLAYSPDLIIVLDGNTGGTGSYPSAPATFSITSPNGTTFSVNPQTADSTYSGYPVATAAQIAIDINTAATTAGADITATSGTNTLTITGTGAGTLTITNTTNDPFGGAAVGNGSGTGLPTGTFSAPALEEYLALERTDGGDVLLQGNWIGTVDSAGLWGVSGTPPFLLMLENDNDTLSTYYTGSLLDNKTQNINFSGSGVEVTTSGSDGILVTIDGGGSGGTYTNSDPTPINFPSDDDPNIPSGTTFANKTFPEMMDLMLYPELDPTLTNPSNTFSISPSGLREIGETIATITLSATFSKGSINPQYTSATPFRSGDPNTYVYTGTGTSNNASTSLTDTELVTSYTVLQGSNSWTGAVSYDAGPQPKTSKDNDYDSPLSAGTTSAITRTITGVYPAFATTSAIGTLTKQSLQVMTTYIQVSMVAETGNGDKQTIDIPDAWSTITGLQQFNTLSGTWDSISLSSFTTSATTQTIQGNSVNYTKYAYNGSTIGARQLRFTV